MKKKYIILITTLFLILTPILSVLAVDDGTPIDTGTNVQCDPNSQIRLNVPIGNLKCLEKGEGENILGNYIQLWYGFVIGMVGILSAVIIMYAGFKWLTSRGNSSVISDSKEKIWAALTGLLLAFLSFVILNIVNPKLLTINLPTLEGIKTDTKTRDTFTSPDTPDGYSNWGSEGYLIAPSYDQDGAQEYCANRCRNDYGSSIYQVTPRAEGYWNCNCGEQNIDPVNPDIFGSHDHINSRNETEAESTCLAYCGTLPDHGNSFTGDVELISEGDDGINRYSCSCRRID